MTQPLFPVLEPTHPLIDLDPAQITVERIAQRDMVAMQAGASKAVWRPAPGRKNSYAVCHAGRAIGLLFLASPVINLAPRGLSRYALTYAGQRVAEELS